MADITKSFGELAKLIRNLWKSQSPHKKINPFYVTVSNSEANSPWVAPTNTRSITFVIWGVNNAGDSVTITFPDDSLKSFVEAKYDGYTFSYTIDVNRDSYLSSTITIDVGEGDASVDIIYTTESCCES